MILAAIVAGGTGTRMGGELPKQFMTLHSKPVLICTIECFLRHPSVDAVIVGGRKYPALLRRGYHPVA